MFQVNANLELYGPNNVLNALEVPAWVRFLKCLFGGSSLFLWTASILCFASYSIHAGTSDSPPAEQLVLGFVLVAVVFITGTFSFVQERKGAAIAKQWDNLAPRTAHVVREYEDLEVDADEVVIGDIIKLKVLNL